MRLDYASIPKDKIILVEDMNDLLSMIKDYSEGNIYTMVCFDMTEIITKMLKEWQDEKND